MPVGLAFSPAPLPSLARSRSGPGRYPSRPAPGPACPGCLTALFTGMRKLLDQKRIWFRPFQHRLPGQSIFTHSPFLISMFKGGPCPYPSVTSSSGLPCPFSRYRTELQTYSAIEKMRPVDGQRLPSAHPAALTASLKKDWLPPPFTDPPAILSPVSKE